MQGLIGLRIGASLTRILSWSLVHCRYILIGDPKKHYW